MDRDTLIEMLKDIAQRQEAGGSDIENDHMEADSLLLEYLEDKAINVAFRDIKKWYA